MAAAVAAAVTAGLAGCGSAQRKPDPVTLPAFGYHPTAPKLPAGLPPGTVVVSDLTHTAALRPSSLQFASDATLAGVHWSSWGGSTASGSGTASVRICSPNCAQGSERLYPARVTLLDPKACYGSRFYSSAKVTVQTPGASKPWVSFISAPC